MADIIQNCLTLNYKCILIDEVALEGLSGIGLDLLWKRVEKRISSPITDKMKTRFWGFLRNCDAVSFYESPEPLPTCTEILDRFMIVDESSGHILDPPEYLDGHYEYCPVANDHGSCINYDTRKKIPREEIVDMGSFEIVNAQYGNTLIMVASLEERWKALAPHLPISVLSQLSPLHFCMLELIGRSRENGQTTLGKTNLTKIVKEPKLLFYNRKQLQKLGVIKALCITIKVETKGIKGLLLRLKRFHKPSILSMPKVGKLHNVKEYLLNQPDYCEKTDVVISKGLISQHNSKRLQKTINSFKFIEKLVQSQSLNKKSSKAGVFVKRRFIALDSKSDESSHSENEESEVPLKCQFKIGVGLMRQAYERFLDAGLKGLTQIEVSQLLGVEFYTSRSICRIFKSRHIIREYLEDKGKQRTARYFAVAAATGEMHQKYEVEKRKFLEYMTETKTEDQPQSSDKDTQQDEDDIPLKKIKLENENQQKTSAPIEEEVTEIKVLDGLQNFNSESLLFSKKKPTLRQLRFANGLLKITRERLVVSGYQTLSSLVSKETGEPPLDTKALKIFVQKLVTDGQLKLLKVKWPSFQNKYSILICSPVVKCTDPVVKAKQREISIRAFTNKTIKKTKPVDFTHIPLAQYAYPRYMKIQLLHEFLMKLVYFDNLKLEYDLPQGFASLVNVIPEIPVEFAIGNISNIAASDIDRLNIDQDTLKSKMKDAPEELYQRLLQSKSLQSSIRLNLKVLAMLGLIQLVNRQTSKSTSDHSNTLSNYVFYVNRQAKILDTTGTWPRSNVDIKALEKKFFFENASDVKAYWTEVYEISTHTSIDYPNRCQKNLFPPVRQIHEVDEYDNGQLFGDGAGPCGFDSCFYMEYPRFWRSFYTRIIKNKPIKKITRRKKLIKEKKPKKEEKKKNPKKRLVKPPVVHNICPKIPPVRPVRNRPDSTIKWSKWEDTVIMMCKVAITIISPVSQPGCLKIRNTAARDLLSIFDPKKICSVCHRRAETLEMNLSLQHEKECLINELRKRRHLIVKYEGLLRKLKIKYITNLTKLINEVRLPMLELLWLINQFVEKRSKAPLVPCIAEDMQDFHNKFTMVTSTSNRPYNGYKTQACSEKLIAVVKEAIIMSLITNFENIQTPDDAKKIFSVFSEIPERTLRIALEQLRKCSAVACKDKLLNNLMHRFNVHEAVPSSFKISAAYRRKWINRLNTEFADGIAEMLGSEVSQTGIVANPEVNCVLCELQSCGVLEIISMTVPVITGPSGSILQEQQLNVSDIEVKFKLKSGILGWKNISNIKWFTDYFGDVNYEEPLSTLLRNSIIETPEDPDAYTQNDIVNHLKEKGENGALLDELMDCFGNNTSLTQTLEELESKKIIKRVGYYENRIVLTEFAKLWAMEVDEKILIPTPWLTFDSSIRNDVLMQWAGVIMNKVFETPGCSIAYLSNAYEFITTRAVQEVCVFLEKCQCLKLQVLKTAEVDLFSDDEALEFTEFNQYEAPENVYVFPLKDSLIKYAYMRKKILGNTVCDDSDMDSN